MVSFLAGILLSLLPERYRRWWEPASTLDFLRASFVSGLVQGLGCFVVFILRYLAFFQQRVMEMGGQVMGAGAEEALGVSSVQYGMGIVTTLEYLIQPLTLLLIYFALEGAVRLAGAAFTEQILPSLPLHLTAWAQERLAQRRAELARAMINRPHLMIMDEPFRGLDAMSRELMQEFYLRLFEQNRRTNLFVTSEIEEAIFLADHVVVMSSRPTTVRAVIEIDLPRPRDFNMLSSPEVYEYKRQAMEILHEEALKSFKPSGTQADFVEAYSRRHE